MLCVRMRMAFWQTRGGEQGEEGGREACEEAPSHPIPGFIVLMLATDTRH